MAKNGKYSLLATNFCDKRKQLSLLKLLSVAKILSVTKNFCDKREQSSSFGLPSRAKTLS